MINAVGTFAMSFPPGGQAAAAPADDSALLFGNGALAALDGGRGSVDAIKKALTDLRDALQKARDDASSVPGSTQFTPVTVDIAQTIQRPTYVDVNGQPVKTGTVDVPTGTRAVLVGYDVTPRAPLEVGDKLQAVATQVSSLVASVGGSANHFASDVSALLDSADLKNAIASPDTASIDAAITDINKTLASAAGYGTQIGLQAKAAAQVDFGALLLGATSDSNNISAPSSSASTSSFSGAGAYAPSSSGASGSTFSSVA